MKDVTLVQISDYQMNKEGHVQLLTPLVDVVEAELFVNVLDKNEQANAVAHSFFAATSSAEQAFKSIGLTGFFDTDDDNNVDFYQNETCL